MADDTTTMPAADEPPPLIRTFLVPPGGGYMGHIEFLLQPEQGYKLQPGTPSGPVPSGAMMWVLAKPEVLLAAHA